MELVKGQQEQHLNGASNSTPPPFCLSPSSLTPIAGRTASVGPVQPAYGGWTVVAATSAVTSLNLGAATKSARSVVGANACSLLWWVMQKSEVGGLC